MIRRRFLSLFAGTLALALLAPPLDAQRRGPLGIGVGGPAQRWRPVVLVDGLLDDRALRESLDNGLPLRFRLRVELWRKDVLDRLVGEHEAQRALLRDPLEADFVLEDGRTAQRYASLAATERALQAAFAANLQPPTQGRYYYLVTLEVETLSQGDLDELRRWLRGEARPAVTGEQPVERAVERGLRRFFVRLLGLPTRKYQARSQFFQVG